MASSKASSSAPFVISFGVESFFLDRDLERGLKWPGRALTTVEGDGTSDVDLVGICESRTMDDSPRVVVVDEANKIKGDKALRTYIEEKNPKDDSIVLVAIIRSEKCSDVWQLAAKKGKLIEHKKLKTYENNNEVVRWVETEAMRIGLRLDKGISEALFSLLGSDLYRISSELRKLLLLVGKDQKATKEHLKLVIAPAPTAEPYQVAEAAMNKDLRGAMNLLSTVYKNMGDDANVPIAYALMRQIEKLTVVRSLLERGVPEDELAASIGMHPFRFKSSVLPQVRKHSLSDLVRIMSRLCKLDTDVKGPARSKRTHIELAVLSVAG
jgi:DNA polymerase-3 subunit delta